MSKGKIAAQCAHAAVGAYRTASRAGVQGGVARQAASSIIARVLGTPRELDHPRDADARRSDSERAGKWEEWLRQWERSGQAKVVVKARSLEELRDACGKATQMGIPVSSVRDAGRTEVEAGTVTVAAVGPAPGRTLNRVTGNLPLL